MGWAGACQESDEQEAFKRQLSKMSPAEIRDYALRLVGRRPMADDKQDGQLGKAKEGVAYMLFHTLVSYTCCIHQLKVLLPTLSTYPQW